MFQEQKRLAKWRKLRVKNGFKELLFFLLKSCKYTFWTPVLTIRSGSNFDCMWSKFASNIVWRDFWLQVLMFEMVARKSFIDKFTSEIDFLILCYHYCRWHLKSNMSKKTYLRKCWRHFRRCFCDINNCLMLK